MLRTALACLLPLAFVGCAVPPVGEPTTRFVLSDAPVPPTPQPFAELRDDRPLESRKHRYDGVTVLYGDNWLSQPVSDSLRGEVTAQLNRMNNTALRSRLAAAEATLLFFEFSHRPIPAAERRFAVEPTHRVSLKLRIQLGSATVDVDESYKTGSDTPQLTNQMTPYFSTLIQKLLRTIPSV